MADILITAGLFLLILVSLFLLLVVLMQRANTNAGLGAAFGGGITESAFGTEAGNVLSKFTRYAAYIFFGLSLVLYLGILRVKTAEIKEAGLPTFDEVQSANPEPEALQPALAPVEGELLPSAETEAPAQQ